MTTDFEECLTGKYNNFRQAQSAPTLFSQIEILWEKIPGGLHSRQWYRRERDHPYREGYHKVIHVSDKEVVVENYNIDWTRRENCDMIFKFDGRAWNGNILGNKCYRRNACVQSEVILINNQLHSRDKGLDESGNRVWGSDTLYIFTKQGE